VSGAQRLAESAHATKGLRGSAQLLEARAARLARFAWFGELHRGDVWWVVHGHRSLAKDLR
jgi:hypothetical protein